MRGWKLSFTGRGRPIGCRTQVGLYIASYVAIIRDAIVSQFHLQSRKTYTVRISVLAAVLFMAGCVSMSSMANSPVVINQLKIRSAGYTGCTTEENEISNVNPRPDGSGTWNATCKGKVFLCSQGSSEGHASLYSCAAAVN
jgi:hypothetical protein